MAHPLTRGLDIDDPSTTQARRQIIQRKGFLRQTYQEWYAAIAAALPAGREPVLELGSGAGFLERFVPGLITSDIVHCPHIGIVLDGQQLPFSDSTLRAIVMTNVLHHMPRPRRFFAEAARCVQLGGVVVMIEPWVTPWSRLVYTNLHHEPFDTEAPDWSFSSAGPLSGANGALAWMIIERDRSQFEQEFPEWQIQTIEPCMPFCYLLSGGVSLRSLTPGFAFSCWRRMENSLQRWMKTWAMFALIVLVLTGTPSGNIVELPSGGPQ